MKIIKVLGVILILAAIIAVLPGCKAKSNTVITTTQTATVTRGNLTQEITAAGNLVFANTQNLAFQVAGTVAEVDVNAGDTVKKGQVLAKLDTTAWDQSIVNLQNAVTVAQHNYTIQQNSLVNAQRGVTSAQNAVAGKQLAIQTAQLAVQTANATLNSIQVVAAAQDDVNNAELFLKAVNVAMGSLSGGGYVGLIDATTITYWQNLKIAANQALLEAKANLKDVLNNTGVNLSSDVELQLTQAEFNIVLKQQAVIDAQSAVDDANYAVTQAKITVDSANYSVNQAQISLHNAQQALDDANAQSPIITAPFDGFIPSIGVAGGDIVYKGTVAMTIADPTKFETNILVSEMNILSVNLDTVGTLSAQAISGVNFPVQVTYVAPTATIASSVVNYSVTVELTSLTPIPTTTASSFLPSGNSTQPSGFSPPAGFTPSAGFTPPAGFTPSAGSRQRKAASSSNTTQYTLKSGMTVTVTLEIPISTNVLIVPSAAIKTQTGQSYVVVLSDDGTTKNITVTTGNSDDTNTEITSGLSEGQKVVISSTSQSSGKTAVTTTVPRGGGNILFGGGGR
jgi:multidrug efflux pump subunit AcrA (membrane-fusion protein)